MVTVRDTPKRGEASCGTSAHWVRSCARHATPLGRKREPSRGKRCAHPSMLRASQERDWIAVPVRRNADGEQEQEGEAVEHTKGETCDLCPGEPRHTPRPRGAALATRAVLAPPVS